MLYADILQSNTWNECIAEEALRTREAQCTYQSFEQKRIECLLRRQGITVCAIENCFLSDYYLEYNF